jgi:hypothetical protein
MNQLMLTDRLVRDPRVMSNCRAPLLSGLAPGDCGAMQPARSVLSRTESDGPSRWMHWQGRCHLAVSFFIHA